MKPEVIWMGKMPNKGHEIFRVIDMGPPREHVQAQHGGTGFEPRFHVEQSRGVDHMMVPQWGEPHPSARPECIRALVEAFGKVLNHPPQYLRFGHPIGCELNMALIEGRDPKGCDCEDKENGDAAGYVGFMEPRIK